MKRFKSFIALVTILVLYLTSCSFTIGDIDEIDIPSWLKGNWNIYSENHERTDWTVRISDNSIIFSHPQNGEHDIINDVINSAGSDEEYEDAYILRYSSSNGYNEYTFKRNKNSSMPSVFFFPYYQQEEIYYVLEMSN